MKIAGYMLEFLCWAMVLVCAAAVAGAAFANSFVAMVYFLFLGFIMAVFGFIMRESNSEDAARRKRNRNYSR